MELLEKISLTENQIQKIEQGGVITIEASWEEFMDFLEETTYKAEYSNGKIIIMGLASAIHEYLVSWVITLLNIHYQRNNFFVFSSNLGVKTGDKKGYFNPDITVVKGKLEFFNESTAIILNPYLIVEVLSESTYFYDLQEKLYKYQAMKSVHEVVFIDRFEKAVYKFQKTENPKVWTETIYDHENPEILIDTMDIKLNDIFDKIDAFIAI
jgi:Uma2 family endonuclease